jgi:hypothetical protein
VEEAFYAVNQFIRTSTKETTTTMPGIINSSAQKKLLEIVDNEETLYTERFPAFSPGTATGIGWFIRLKTFAELSHEVGYAHGSVRICLAEQRPEISKRLLADRGKLVKVYPHEVTDDEILTSDHF